MVRALEDMRIHEGTTDVPQPSVPRDEHLDGTWPHSFRHTVPRPPTPPRPSQKRLGKEEALPRWSDDSNSNSVDGDADDTANNGQNQNETKAASSPMDGDELSRCVVDDRTRDDDSLVQNRVRTQEETAALEHMIFGDEDEELDEAFWETDGALQTAVAYLGEHEGAGATEQQAKDDRTRRELEESEGEVDEAPKSDGLFGSTSTTYTSTASEDGHPRSHQDVQDGNPADVQDVPEVAPDSVSVDASENVWPTPTTTPTTFTLLRSPTPPRTAFDSSSPTKCPTSPESGFGTRRTKNEAPTGTLHPGELPEADVGADDDRPDPVSVPITPVNRSAEDLRPCKPAVVARSEGAPQCNTMRRIIHKMGLPEFGRTRSSIFSIPTVASSDDGSLGKRKRSCEDDRDDGLPVSPPR